MKTSIKKKSTFKKVLTGLALTGSLVGLPGISAANPAKYVSDSLAKMNTCGFTKPSDMYSACLALQHPDRIGDYDRWNIRGSICAEITKQMGGTVAYDSRAYNAASDTLAGTNCDDAARYVARSITKMNTCGFTKSADIYSACLALQHPDRTGDYDTWNMRGTICTEVKRQMSGTEGWNPTPYNSASGKIAETNCDKAALRAEDSIFKMKACGFTKPATVYSECLALQHPDRTGDYDAYNMRGTICTEVKRQMGGTGGWIPAAHNAALDTIAETKCDVGVATHQPMMFQAPIGGSLCGLEWSGTAGSVAHVEASERVAKVDCDSKGDALYYNDETQEFYTKIGDKACYLQGSRASGGAVQANEHVAKFDCGDGAQGDPIVYDDSTSKFTTQINGRVCALEWNGQPGTQSGIGVNEHLVKFDCGGSTGDRFLVSTAPRALANQSLLAFQMSIEEVQSKLSTVHRSVTTAATRIGRIQDILSKIDDVKQNVKDALETAKLLKKIPKAGAIFSIASGPLSLAKASLDKLDKGAKPIARALEPIQSGLGTLDGFLTTSATYTQAVILQAQAVNIKQTNALRAHDPDFLPIQERDINICGRALDATPNAVFSTLAAEINRIMDLVDRQSGTSDDSCASASCVAQAAVDRLSNAMTQMDAELSRFESGLNAVDSALNAIDRITRDVAAAKREIDSIPGVSEAANILDNAWRYATPVGWACTAFDWLGIVSCPSPQELLNQALEEVFAATFSFRVMFPVNVPDMPNLSLVTLSGYQRDIAEFVNHKDKATAKQAAKAALNRIDKTALKEELKAQAKEELKARAKAEAQARAEQFVADTFEAEIEAFDAQVDAFEAQVNQQMDDLGLNCLE